MKRLLGLAILPSLVCSFALGLAEFAAAAEVRTVDQMLAGENADNGVTTAPLPVVDDLAYLRRVSVDLIGRIPNRAEIDEYLAWPSKSRREMVVDKFLNDPRFDDRWTVFYSDMFRLRSNAEGGAQAIAFVHKAVSERMPYDEMCRRLISTNGKVGSTPEVGFVLGDNADPMALAGVTSQVFLGIRIACAQCHDHPFDVWKREDFYGLAAYFGKTRRIERRFQNRILSIYTTDDPKTAVLWPPEGVGDPADRKPMEPRFPFELASKDTQPEYIARLIALRAQQEKARQQALAKSEGPSVDDLLDSAAETAVKATSGVSIDKVASEAKREARQVGSQISIGGTSELREELAELVTHPGNRFFSRSFANRVWTELVGRGFVEPVDDFTETNTPSHPRTLDFLADEFVANGYDLRTLVRMIVTSDVYQRSHAYGVDEAARQELEATFLATPMRRMISEALYDSIVTAGHLFDVKHEAGRNLKVVWQQTRIMKQPRNGLGLEENLADAGDTMKAMPAKREMAAAPGYSVEKAIELDFENLLKAKDDEESGAVAVEEMRVMSTEEIEAERMRMEARQRAADYVDRFVRTVIDDNPVFSTSLRMASPAAPEHFLRVFGQPGRTDLGEVRDHSPSMRQALMMLNGKLTNEAARVGDLEPIRPMLVGRQANLDKAIELAYLEIFTRKPLPEELADAKAVIGEAANPLDGMADLRWVMLNSNEFRFLP